jgi:hypothetical protein
VPGTLQGLLVLVLAVLPGAMYVWGFEREAGKWRIGLSDAVLRFVVASALFQVVFAAPLYGLYQRYVHHDVTRGGQAVLRNGRPAHENLLAEGDVPVTLFLVPLAYIAIPAALGTVVGRAVQSRKPRPQRFGRVFAGKDPAPRGWDHLFTSRPSGTVRVRLKDGSWIGGAFGEGSYAAGYPDKPQDLLLERSYQLRDDGSFVKDQHGDFVGLGSRILVGWEEMRFLEFFPLPSADEPDDGPTGPSDR